MKRPAVTVRPSGLVVMTDPHKPVPSPKTWTHESLGMEQLPKFIQAIEEQDGELIVIFAENRSFMSRYTVVYRTPVEIGFEVRT
jgi:hypothetical protein